MTNNEPNHFKELIKNQGLTEIRLKKKLYNNFEQYCYSISFSIFFFIAIISHKNLKKIIKLEEL